MDLLAFIFVIALGLQGRFWEMINALLSENDYLKENFENDDTLPR